MKHTKENTPGLAWEAIGSPTPEEPIQPLAQIASVLFDFWVSGGDEPSDLEDEAAAAWLLLTNQAARVDRRGHIRSSSEEAAAVLWSCDVARRVEAFQKVAA